MTNTDALYNFLAGLGFVLVGIPIVIGIFLLALRLHENQSSK